MGLISDIIYVLGGSSLAEAKNFTSEGEKTCPPKNPRPTPRRKFCRFPKLRLYLNNKLKALTYKDEENLHGQTMVVRSFLRWLILSFARYSFVVSSGRPYHGAPPAIADAVVSVGSSTSMTTSSKFSAGSALGWSNFATASHKALSFTTWTVMSSAPEKWSNMQLNDLVVKDSGTIRSGIWVWYLYWTRKENYLSL